MSAAGAVYLWPQTLECCGNPDSSGDTALNLLIEVSQAFNQCADAASLWRWLQIIEFGNPALVDGVGDSPRASPLDSVAK